MWPNLQQVVEAFLAEVTELQRFCWYNVSCTYWFCFALRNKIREAVPVAKKVLANFLLAAFA